MAGTVEIECIASFSSVCMNSSSHKIQKPAWIGDKKNLMSLFFPLARFALGVLFGISIYFVCVASWENPSQILRLFELRCKKMFQVKKPLFLADRFLQVITHSRLYSFTVLLVWPLTPQPFFTCAVDRCVLWLCVLVCVVMVQGRLRICSGSWTLCRHS